MTEYMDIKWQPIVKTRASLLFQWYVFVGHRKKYYKNSLGIDFGLRNQKIVADEISIDLNEFIQLEKLLTSKIQENKHFIKNFITSCYEFSARLLDTFLKIKVYDGFGNLNSKELLNFYLEYEKSVLGLMPFLNTILVIDGILKKEIIKNLEKDLHIKDKQEQDLLISKLIIPKKKSFFVEETEEILKIAIKSQADPNHDISLDVQKYLDKFAWMTSIAYLGKFQTEEFVREKIDSLLKENPKEKLSQIELIRQQTQSDFNTAFKEISTVSELKEMIDFSREMLYLQTYRLDIFFLAYFNVYKLLEEISRRLKIQSDDVVYLTGEEIVNCVSKQEVFSLKTIQERKQTYALILENDKFTLFAGDQVKKTIKQTTLQKEVRGTVASRGRATGKVKLLLTVDDISKVERGDIIVSPMTRPELVPAIIRSGGIITDFGGMLCHAAIISREFGIPCLVGTLKATSVFTDGDIVELNAYDGIARKV